MRPKFAITASITALWCVAHARSESLTYVLTPKFDEGRLHVEVTWETEGRQQSYLAVSSHFGRIDQVADLLHGVSFDGVTAANRSGSIWQIDHRRNATIHCEYDVATGHKDIDWDSIHYPIVTRDFFHGIGNSFLLVPQIAGHEKEQYEVVLSWKIPSGQSGVCSWGAGRSVGGRIRAADLRNSVYLAGKIVTESTKRDGLDVTVAIVDRFDFKADAFARLTSSIIKAQTDFMHERDFPPFVITAVPVGPPVREGEARLSGSGLYDSFTLFAAPKSDLNDAAEHLFAHELFHFWNGRTLEAADPERLVYWFTEGLTDYYALRILFESGRWDGHRYAKWVNKHIREYASNPARNASNERIQQDYWNQRDTVGEVAYQRGLLLGLRWNRLAHEHGVSDGIDRLFFRLVERGRDGGMKLTNGIIRQAGVETLGAWFGPEFDRYVEQAETIDLPNESLAPRFLGQLTDVHDFELGFDREKSLKNRKLSGVTPGGPAAAAGLKNGEELAGWSISVEADKPVTLQVKRGKEVKAIEYFPRGAKRQVIQFEPASSARPARE